MGYPVDLKRVHGGIASKNRRVDECIEIGSAVVMHCPTWRCRETSDSSLPGLGEDQLHVMETIFGLPGMGRFLVDAIFQRDYPVVQGVILLTSLITVVINLLVDMTYAQLDPRIRYQ